MLSTDAVYWALRQRFNEFRFGRIKFQFGMRQAGDNGTRTARLLVEIFGSGIRRGIGALMMLALSIVLDHFLGPLGTRVGFRSFEVDPGTIVTFAATSLQVFVVIAGLYYAAMSVVISAGYRDVSGALYRLLTEITPGQAYLRATITLASFACGILALETLKVVLGPWTVVILSILVLLDVAAFATAGRLAFDLFNPRRLVPIVEVRLRSEIDAACPPANGAQIPEIQDVRRRQVRQQIDALSDIAALCRRDGGATAVIIAATCRLLLKYSRLLPYFAQDSKWFEYTLEHKSWFESDYFQVTLAIDTATELQPSIVPDRSWFERALLPPTLSAFEITLERARPEEIQATITDLAVTTQELASAYAINTVELLTPALFDLLVPDELPVDYPILLEYRRGSAAALLLTVGALGLALSVKAFGSDTIAEALASSGGGKRAAALPVEVNILLDEFREGWRVEELAEGQRISPTAYISELCSNEYFVQALAQARRHYHILERSARQVILTTNDDTSYIVAGFLMGALESVEKCATLIFELAQLHQRLRPSDSLLAEDAWNRESIDKLLVDLRALRRDILVALLTVAVAHAGEPPTGDMPRFTEAAFQHGAVALYEAVASGKADERDQLSPGVFLLGRALIGAAGAADRLRTTGAWLALDLCELCGYAILYSHLQRDETASELLTSSLYLSLESDASRLAALVQLADYGHSPYNIGPRMMMRQNWEAELIDRLHQAVGISRDEMRYSRERPDFGSTLLNLSYGGFRMTYDAFEVFAAVFAAEIHPPVLEFLDHNVAALRERLKRSGNHAADDEAPRDE